MGEVDYALIWKEEHAVLGRAEVPDGKQERGAE